MREITSLQNSTIKDWRKLQQAKYRKKTGQYLLEGVHLVEEAVKCGAAVKDVLVTAEFLKNAPHWWAEISSQQIVLVTWEIIKSLSEVPAPQGILAIVEIPQVSLAQFSLNKPLLLLDAVQDPGNVGTMIRSADAAGFGGVILGTGTADIYQGKVLRSMQGSHFHLPVLEADLLSLWSELKAADYQILGTALDKAAASYKDVTPGERFALVLGNEGQGLAAEILAATDQNLYIPMKGQAESLNVAVAAGILMFALFS